MTKKFDNIPFIVVSAHRVHDGTRQSQARHEALRDLIGDIAPVKEGRGVWCGEDELSLLVFSMDTGTLEYVEELAFDVFDQDAVLRVDVNRYATLADHNGRTVKTGRWHEVTEDEARGQSHTVVDGRWFVTR